MSVSITEGFPSDKHITEGVDKLEGIHSYIRCIIEMVKDRFSGNIEKEQLIKRALNDISKLNPKDDGCFDPNRLLESALKNIFSNLDRYSVFHPAHAAKIIAENMEGNWYGIGIQLARIRDNVIVNKVHPSSPAEMAGISIGDTLVEINGMHVNSGDVEGSYSILNGESGDELSLGIMKNGSDNITKVNLLRQIIIDGGVVYRIENSVGYIKIYFFNKHTGECVDEALGKIDNAGIKKIILDLRHNSGGSLKQAVLAAKRFVPEGLIVKLKFKSCIYEDIEYYSELKENKYRLVVLVNDETASSSEVLAGAIQDTGAGILIGKGTHGKTAVQKTIPLITYEAYKKVKSMIGKDVADADELRGKHGIKIWQDELIGAGVLTVGEYITPNGRQICNTGLEPDIYVDDDEAIRKFNKYCIEKLGGIFEFAMDDESIDIHYAKAILKAIGYDVGTKDYKIDEATAEAILKFQSDKYLKTTGILDITTQQALNNIMDLIIYQKDLQYTKALQVLDRASQ